MRAGLDTDYSLTGFEPGSTVGDLLAFQCVSFHAAARKIPATSFGSAPGTLKPGQLFIRLDLAETWSSRLDLNQEPSG